MWWRRLLVVPLLALVLGGGLTVALAPPAAACSCADPDSDEVWADADVVVSGRLVDREGEPETGGDDIVYEVAVASVYKGEATEVLTFTTASYGSACGWHPDLSDDDQVIVLFDTPDTGLTTSSCTMFAALPVPDSYVGTEVPPEPGGTGLDPDPGGPGPGVDDAPSGGQTSWWLLGVALAAGAVVLTTAWLVLRRPLR